MYAYILLLIFSILSVQSFFYRNLKNSIESDTLIFELILNAEKASIISYELYQNQRYLEDTKQLNHEFLKNNLEKFASHSFSPTVFSINQSIYVAKIISIYDLMAKNVLYVSDVKVIDLDIYEAHSKLNFNKTNLNLQMTLQTRGGSTFRPTPVPIIREASKKQSSNKVKTGIHISSLIIMLLTCLQVVILLHNTSNRPIPASKINTFKLTLEDVVGPISHRMNFFNVFSRIFSNKQALNDFLLTLKKQGILLNPITLFNLCLTLFFADVMNPKTISAWTSVFLVAIPGIISYLSFKNDNANVLFYAFFTGMLFDIGVTWLNRNYYYKLFFIYLQIFYFIFFMTWSDIVAMFNDGNYLLHRISQIIKFIRELINKLRKVWKGEFEPPTEVMEPPITVPYSQNVKSFETPKIEMPLVDVHDNAVPKIGEKFPIIDAEFIKDNDLKSLKEYPLNRFIEIEKVIDNIFTKPIKNRK